jgi:tRNA (uracil-5-)-methyltransferase TRM9
MAPPMDAKTRAQLNQVNRAFYEGTADAFSDTRRAPWPGWERAMSHVSRSDAGPLSVLDAGCGNGRFAPYLAETEARTERGTKSCDIQYLGIDSSASLLAHAKQSYADLTWAEFREHDVLELASDTPSDFGPFDLIVAFGVLHHIPGSEARRGFLHDLVSLLSARGVLVVTAWQFGAVEHFTSRAIAWSDYNRGAEQSIDEAELEEGDYLLGFGSSPHPRYCHFTSAAELHELFRDAPVTWVDEYCDDGKTQDLNRYAVVSRTGSSSN